MKLKKYEEFVTNNAKQPLDLADGIYSFVGLAGESGECLEWAKKHIFRKDPRFTEDMLKDELGDVVHYVTRIGLYYGWGLKDIINRNVEKLEERHGSN
jgi:NTP pyrophosphatase (non-canonical NTP hydrolase)